MKFEHIAGGVHVEKDGKVYKKGQIVSAPHDLAKMFPGKFRLVDASPAPAPAAPPPAEGGKRKIVVKKIAAAPTPEDARGVEVTSQVEDLDEAFRVFQRGDLFWVYEGASTAPINKAGLKKVAEAVDVVKKFLEE